MPSSYHKRKINATPSGEESRAGGALARLEIAGGVVTLRASTAYGRCAPTVRISAEEYLIKATGEIVQMRHGAKRTDNAQALKRSMERLRGYVNANFGGGPDAAKSQAWITLTYRENVRDTRRVQEDWEAWIRWYRRRIGAEVEYITAIEPQARGAWHLHALVKRTDGGEIYVPHSELLAAWRKVAARKTPAKVLEGGKTAGGLHVHALEGIDNLGAYLSSYLCDDDGKKGARLHLYPTGLHYYRCSKGIKVPEVKEYTTVSAAREAAKAITGQAAHWEEAYEVVDEEGTRVMAGIIEQYKRR